MTPLHVLIGFNGNRNKPSSPTKYKKEIRPLSQVSILLSSNNYNKNLICFFF